MSYCLYSYGTDASKLSSKLRATMLLTHKNYRVTVELAAQIAARSKVRLKLLKFDRLSCLYFEENKTKHKWLQDNWGFLKIYELFYNFFATAKIHRHKFLLFKTDHLSTYLPIINCFYRRGGCKPFSHESIMYDPKWIK